MTLSYAEMFTPEVESTIRPLAVQVAKFRRELEALKVRAATEAENAVRAAEDVANLKAVAGETLAADQNGFERFKRSIGKVTGRLESLNEVGQLFAEIITAKTVELAEALRRLEQALSALAVAKRPQAEAAMTAKLAEVVAERDQFVAAVQQLHATFGLAMPQSITPPTATSTRLQEIRRWISKPPQLSFNNDRAVHPAVTPPPAEPMPAVATPPPAACLTPLDSEPDELDELPTSPVAFTPLDGDQDVLDDAQAGQEARSPEAASADTPAPCVEMATPDVALDVDETALDA